MPLFFRPLNVDIASHLLLSENSRSLFEMKSRHAIKQGLRCLHGVLCGPLGLPLITLVAGVSALAAFLLIACLMPREAPLREMPIPFGPFLSLGAFVHILAGQEILDWWIRFITG